MPNYPIEDVKIFIYGLPKTGKSTFASNLKGGFFLSTEAGLTYLKARNKKIGSWPEFKKFVDTAEKTPEKYTSVSCFILDTVDRLYTHCYNHVMESLNIKAPRKNNFGEDWKALRTEWEGTINRLNMLGKGVLFIGHAKEIEVIVEDSVLSDVTVPGYVSGMPNAGKEYILKSVDFAWCADQVTSTHKDANGKKVKKTEPFIFTVPSDKYPECGGRVPLPPRLRLNYTGISMAFNAAITEFLAQREAPREKKKTVR